MKLTGSLRAPPLHSCVSERKSSADEHDVGGKGRCASSRPYRPIRIHGDLDSTHRAMHRTCLCTTPLLSLLSYSACGAPSGFSSGSAAEIWLRLAH